jgi:hypothetical protein
MLTVAAELGDTLGSASVGDAHAETLPEGASVTEVVLEGQEELEHVAGCPETVTVEAAVALRLSEPLALTVRVRVRVAEGDSVSENVGDDEPLRETRALLALGLPLGDREALDEPVDEREAGGDLEDDRDGELERDAAGDWLLEGELPELREARAEGDREGVAAPEREALPDALPVALSETLALALALLMTLVLEQSDASGGGVADSEGDGDALTLEELDSETLLLLETVALSEALTLALFTPLRLKRTLRVRSALAVAEPHAVGALLDSAVRELQPETDVVAVDRDDALPLDDADTEGDAVEDALAHDVAVTDTRVDPVTLSV